MYRPGAPHGDWSFRTSMKATESSASGVLALSLVSSGVRSTCSSMSLHFDSIHRCGVHLVDTLLKIDPCGLVNQVSVEFSADRTLAFKSQASCRVSAGASYVVGTGGPSFLATPCVRRN